MVSIRRVFEATIRGGTLDFVSRFRLIGERFERVERFTEISADEGDVQQNVSLQSGTIFRLSKHRSNWTKLRDKFKVAVIGTSTLIVERRLSLRGTMDHCFCSATRIVTLHVRRTVIRCFSFFFLFSFLFSLTYRLTCNTVFRDKSDETLKRHRRHLWYRIVQVARHLYSVERLQIIECGVARRVDVIKIYCAYRGSLLSHQFKFIKRQEFQIASFRISTKYVERSEINRWPFQTKNCVCAIIEIWYWSRVKLVATKSGDWPDNHSLVTNIVEKWEWVKNSVTYLQK